MNSEDGQPNAKGAKETQKPQKDLSGGVSDFSHEIIGAAVEVQRQLGVGLLESAYAAALAIELEERGLRFRREVPVAGRYKGRDLGIAFRADLVVEDSVIVEIKAVSLSVEAHRAQLLSYLRLADMKLGLLINFHDLPLTKTVQRVVNKL